MTTSSNQSSEQSNPVIRLIPLQRGEREVLPGRRHSTTYKAKIGGSSSLYLTTGENNRGELREIFLSQSKIGTFSRGMMEAFAIAVSIGLQFGVPLKVLTDRYKNSVFEPNGYIETEDADLNLGTDTVSSPVDWIFRVLEHEYPNQ